MSLGILLHHWNFGTSSIYRLMMTKFHPWIHGLFSFLVQILVTYQTNWLLKFFLANEDMYPRQSLEILKIFHLPSYSQSTKSTGGAFLNSDQLSNELVGVVSLVMKLGILPYSRTFGRTSVYRVMINKSHPWIGSLSFLDSGELLNELVGRVILAMRLGISANHQKFSTGMF